MAVDNSPILVNMALKYLIFFVISKMKFSKVSKKTQIIMVYVFILQFLNTGPLFLFVNMDLSEIWVNSPFDFNGLHTDYTI
jgi:hypothetical protein